VKLHNLFIFGLCFSMTFMGCDSSKEAVGDDTEETSAAGNEETTGDETVDGMLKFGDGDGALATIDAPLRAESSERAMAELAVSWGEEIVTDDAMWSSADETVATISIVDDVAIVQAQGAGSTEISASYQDAEVTLMVTVIAPLALVVTGPERELKPGDAFSLGMKVQWSDESVEEAMDGVLNEGITWMSTTEAASVSEEGEVTIESFGQVEIIAQAQTTLGQEVIGSWGVEIPCFYPEPTGRSFNTDLEFGTVLPPIKWENAYSAMDGSIAPLSMEEVYCSADFEWVKTINFLISAGWCTACPSHLRAVRDMSDDLLEAGGLLVYIEVQDDDGEPADSAFAWNELSELLGPTNGYFVGDKETQPLTRFFGRSPALQAFPDAYVVRRSDMHLLTSLDLNRSVGVLPLVRIAEDPDQDWSTIMPAPFESTCAEGDEEASEPNDTTDQAAVIEPGSYTGGICTEGPDYYQINLEGSWTFNIMFSHAEADIDIYQYPIGQSSGDPVAVSNGTEDVESISGTGPAVIGVFSYTRTSTTYDITLLDQ
jgi:hypothetical protein